MSKDSRSQIDVMGYKILRLICLIFKKRNYFSFKENLLPAEEANILIKSRVKLFEYLLINSLFYVDGN